MEIQKKVVDFLPQTDLRGDLSKHTDSAYSKINSKVSALLTLLMMEQGTHPEYPDMGARTYLLELLESERQRGFAAISGIESQAKRFLDLDVILEAEQNTIDSNIMDLNFSISGLPGKVKLGVQNVSSVIRILNPVYLTS